MSENVIIPGVFHDWRPGAGYLGLKPGIEVTAEHYARYRKNSQRNEILIGCARCGERMGCVRSEEIGQTWTCAGCGHTARVSFGRRPA